MLRIAMPTSFEDALLDRIAELNHRYADRGVEVAELYGSLPVSATGCGRPSRSLPAVERDAFDRHVARARERGLSFTYVVNASCTGNREYEPAGRAAMVDELRRARDAGARSVVVASPFLLDLARRHVPELRIHVSTIASVKTTKEARHFARQGAARLVLDPDTIRDLPFIRRLRAECPELELEALCNHPCLLHCPYEAYCYNAASHASSAAAGGGAPFEAYALLRCHADKLRDPAEVVKGSWFRPQDAHHFEAAGVSVLKIAGRGRSTAWLARTAEAYLSREYHGDMLDLVWDAQWTAVRRTAGELPAARPIRAPADRFDGFIDFFAKGSPRCRDGCGSCRHCDGYARRALEVDEPALAGCRDAVSSAADRLLEIGRA